MTEGSMTDKTASKNPEQTRGRPFEPVQSSGGPGRPAGSRNKATLALDKIADDAGEDILTAMVGAAKGGDMRAAELVLQKEIWPARRVNASDRLDAAFHSIGLRCGRGSRRCG